MAATRDTAYFVQAIRQLSNMEDDPAVTDDEIIDRASEAKSSLYDLILGAYEHYAVKTFDFSLAGGVGANRVTLPTDFYKDVSLDLNPTTTPVTVHRITSWVDRNDQRRRGYTLLGSDLVVEPATVAQGDYQLRYTPLDLPFALPVVATTAYTAIPIGTAGGAVDGTLKSWFFPLAAFNSTYLNGYLNIAGAANSANNGHFLITGVTDGTDVVTAGATPASESFGGGVTASAYLQPLNGIVSLGLTGLLTFAEADFTGMVAGDEIVIAGSATSDGTYTVVSVSSAHVVEVTPPPSPTEFFLPGVTASYQPGGTIDLLPQIMAPWYEYIQVHGAIAVKDKIEQDTADLEVRLQRLTERIQSMAANRMEEGGQIALPNSSRGGFWDDDGFPFGS